MFKRISTEIGTPSIQRMTFLAMAILPVAKEAKLRDHLEGDNPSE